MLFHQLPRLLPLLILIFDPSNTGAKLLFVSPRHIKLVTLGSGTVFLLEEPRCFLLLALEERQSLPDWLGNQNQSCSSGQNPGPGFLLKPGASLHSLPYRWLFSKRHLLGTQGGQTGQGVPSGSRSSNGCQRLIKCLHIQIIKRPSQVIRYKKET